MSERPVLAMLGVVGEEVGVEDVVVVAVVGVVVEVFVEEEGVNLGGVVGVEVD